MSLSFFLTSNTCCQYLLFTVEWLLQNFPYTEYSFSLSIARRHTLASTSGITSQKAFLHMVCGCYLGVCKQRAESGGAEMQSKEWEVNAVAFSHGE